MSRRKLLEEQQRADAADVRKSIVPGRRHQRPRRLGAGVSAPSWILAAASRACCMCPK